MDQRSVRDILAGKTYFIRTFGCQMNQHDSERVSGLLDSYGCLMALDPAHADIVVFMTCCVREAADTRLYGQCNSCKSLPPSPSGKRVVAVGALELVPMIGNVGGEVGVLAIGLDQDAVLVVA